MPAHHEGGCLCGSVRYKTTADPMRVTICHCTFCQKFTGSAFLVEPIFRAQDVEFSGAAPKKFDYKSDSSHKRVTLNSCAKCATTLFLDFERFPDIYGFCGGTFDDPNWFSRSPDKTRHIFTRSAQAGVVLPAGVPIFREHATTLDGAPIEPTILTQPLEVSPKA